MQLKLFTVLFLQICLSLGHLTLMLVPEDLNLMHNNVGSYKDLLQKEMQRAYERMVPEKTGILQSARVHINSLLAQNLSSQQTDVLKALSNAFNVDT